MEGWMEINKSSKQAINEPMSDRMRAWCETFALSAMLSAKIELSVYIVRTR